MSKQFVFGNTPRLKIKRNIFDLSHGKKTTFNVGDLLPILVQEVIPGDTFNVKTSSVIRTTVPFVRPVMDNLYMDTAYFFVPSRLLMDDWSVIFGENKQGAWSVQNPVSVPAVYGPVSVGSLADQMGIPPYEYDETNAFISDLPFRAYALIWNEWYRDENLQDPVFIDKSDESRGYFNNDPWAPDNIYGQMAKVNKLHDRFTSVLPQPQKGSAVPVVLGTQVPIVTAEFAHDVSGKPLLMGAAANGSALPNPGSTLLGHNSSGGQTILTSYGVESGVVQTSSRTNAVPLNLVADLSSSLDALNVNDLRFAFQMQKMLERDARTGTRYREYIQRFGVKSPDARVQVPEYLGGTRNPLTITQVTNQTSSGSDDLALGIQSAYSLSSGISGFTKSFVEHGYVIGLSYVRYKHTYQQGIEKFWTRQNRVDFYDPVFANIGEQPVYKSELDSSAVKTQVFGYNEAWSDMRYRPNQVSGYLRTVAGQGLDIWHFADYYSSVPALGPTWIEETSSYVDRTLSVDSSTIPNFVVDFHHNIKAVRPMPLYSVPGLIDHH